MYIHKKNIKWFFTIILLLTICFQAKISFSTMYYDVNKYWNNNIPYGVDPNDYTDSLMCWAATASNVLRYTGWGVDTDGDGTVHHRLDMYHEFLYAFPNYSGSGSLAYESYFDWHYPDTDIVQAGLFKQVYYDWNDPQLIIRELDNLLVDKYGIYLSITQNGWGGHAVTVWNHITSKPTGSDQKLHFLKITDSDDGTIEEAKTYRILKNENGTRWYLQNYFGKNTFYMRRLDALAPRYQLSNLDQPQTFEPPVIIRKPNLSLMNPVYNLHYQLQLQDSPDGPGSPVPEPTTMLLLGAGLIGLAGLGRKRFFKKD